MNNSPGAMGRMHRRPQRGVSLVEAAVAMAILGVAAVVFWQAIGGVLGRENQDRVQSHLERMHAAVRVFAALHARLPCPASQPNGLEDCAAFLAAGAAGGEAQGFFPYLSAGVPEPGLARLRYTVDGRLMTAGGGRFQVLTNVQPIDRLVDALPLPAGPGDPSAPGPRARLRELRALPPSSTYDGLLDLCAALSPANRRAYMLVLEQGDFLRALATSAQQRQQPVPAAALARYLGCGPMVAVSGRGQYNAHLAGAILAQSIQDYRGQFELAYAITVMEVAEGAWSVAHHSWATLVAWGKGIQAVSALHANMFSPAQLPGTLKTLALSAATQASKLASWAARVSNLVRFSNNMHNFYAHRCIINRLVDASLTRYATATEHAVKGSSSGYFLREQDQASATPALPGPASDFGTNATALSMAALAQQRAGGLGYPGLLNGLATLPPSDCIPADLLDPTVADLSTAQTDTGGALASEGQSPPVERPADLPAVGNPASSDPSLDPSRASALGEAMGQTLENSALNGMSDDAAAALREEDAGNLGAAADRLADPVHQHGLANGHGEVDLDAMKNFLLGSQP